MINQSLSWIIILFILFNVFVKTRLSLHNSNHEFVANTDVRYLVNDISSIHEEFVSGVRGATIKDLNIKLQLKFEPEYLDFKERPLGVPHLEKVTLFNINNNRTIDMTSISGNTVHFHSSFFEDKKIPPLGNTTFNVVFLGREEGLIESNLFIHTTEGSFKYQVKGASVSSPYRLRPIVGVRLPLNSSFSPLIYMHNPHPHPIQIVEVYSSGGDFHLELPTGELEGPKDMWEIPPLHTKPVIRVRFHARTESNHTAYVRFKLNNTDDVLIVPLEVEVEPSAVLHTPQGSVDFGVGGTMDPPKQVKLYLVNTLKKSVKVHSVSTSSKAISVEFGSQSKIPPDSKNSIEVATLTLNWKMAFDTKDFSGKIFIKYKQGKGVIEIPYWVTVLQGGISYNSSLTCYFTNSTLKDFKPRNFALRNNFKCPLAITEVSLPSDAQMYFQISQFKPVVLKPNESKEIFHLNPKQQHSNSDLKFESFILIKSNISDNKIPLLSYNGKLNLKFPYSCNGNNFDLGLIGLDTKKVTYFLLLNNNPVNVNFLKYKSLLPESAVELIKCQKGSVEHALLQNLNIKNVSSCNHLKAGEYAIFRLRVETKLEGQFYGGIVIKTQFETIQVNVSFKVAQGKLEIGPDRLVFDECFPGKICSHPLRVHSTFNEPMIIENILSIPPDPRLSSKHSGHITARVTKIIGHLYLDPSLDCNGMCYTGISINSTVGLQWLKTFSLPESTCDFDLNLVNTLYNCYLNVTKNGISKWQNLTLRLDSSQVKGHIFQSRVKLSWPYLVIGSDSVNRTTFTFPLTQVGNVTYRNITIRNPTNTELIVQLVMDSAYPQQRLLREGLPPSFVSNHYGAVAAAAANKEAAASTTAPKSSESKFFFHQLHSVANATNFAQLFQHAHAHQYFHFVVPANSVVNVTVGFAANDTSDKYTVVYIRNNLTVMEVIQLHGRGAFPNLKFGNRKPGSAQPLLFELTEKHLKDCEREKHRKYPVPNLTVKRSFTARNIGEITVYINGFFINGLPCEGYGFKVLNCEPFALPANGTRKIDIAFTPDFTLAKIQRTLTLETSLSVSVNYTLVTTLPPYYLAPCAAVLARPSWEPLLYYATASFMMFLLVCIVIAAFLESDRILKTVIAVKHDSPETQPTLDLRLIGQQTKCDIRTNKNGLVSGDWSKSAELESKIVKDSSVAAAAAADVAKLSDNHHGSDLTGDKQIKSEQCNEIQCKYSALIPAQSGKLKRKISKKNSNDASALNENVVPEKKTWPDKCSAKSSTKSSPPNAVALAAGGNACKLSALETTPPPSAKKIVVSAHKEVKRSVSNPKKLKPSEPSCYEEETSSTTTESSSNNEEVDKENECLKQDSKNNKKSISRKPKPCCDSNEQAAEETNGGGGAINSASAAAARIAKKSNLIKPLKDTHETNNAKHVQQLSNAASHEQQQNNNNTSGGGGGGASGGKSKNSKGHNSKDRKEKLHAKRSYEKGAHGGGGGNKSSNHCDAYATSSSVNSIPPPPVPPTNCWGENRAKFSDVVARNDTSSSPSSCAVATNKPAACVATLKPTMYVEPTYKYPENKPPPPQCLEPYIEELGPIGTKKLEPWNESPPQQQQTLHHQQQVHELRFQQQQPPPQISNSFFTDTHQSLALESTNAYLDVPQETWDHPAVMAGLGVGTSPQQLPTTEPWTSNSTAYWEPLCAPIGEERQCHQSGYLWGSSSVWHPWTPMESLRGTTRSPPGFPAAREVEEARLSTYDPFRSLNNIWTQENADPWKYHNDNSQ